MPGSIVPQRQTGRRSPFPLDPFDGLIQRRQPTRSARVFLRQLVGESRVVLGQAVRAAIVLDTTAGGVDHFEWLTPPAYPGWWAQRIDPPERVTGEVVEVDGLDQILWPVHCVQDSAGAALVPELEARAEPVHKQALFFRRRRA